jgi:hypothetical protein
MEATVNGARGAQGGAQAAGLDAQLVEGLGRGIIGQARGNGPHAFDLSGELPREIIRNGFSHRSRS